MRKKQGSREYGDIRSSFLKAVALNGCTFSAVNRSGACGVVVFPSGMKAADAERRMAEISACPVCW